MDTILLSYPSCQNPEISLYDFRFVEKDLLDHGTPVSVEEF